MAKVAPRPVAVAARLRKGSGYLLNPKPVPEMLVPERAIVPKVPCHSLKEIPYA